jgi:predicted Zn-dependent protease
MSALDTLRAQIGGPRDGALLRYALARELAAVGDASGAIAECEAALRFDPRYSAAWKLLGQQLAAAGRAADAVAAYERGVAVATAKGDVQAAKEMTVFLKRLRKT